MKSMAFNHIKNLGELYILSIFSIEVNLDNISFGKIFIAKSWKLEGKILVFAATNKVTNKINISNNHIDNEDFRKIIVDKKKFKSPFLENVKYRLVMIEILKTYIANFL